MNPDDDQIRAMLRRRADRVNRDGLDGLLSDAIHKPRFRRAGVLASSAGNLALTLLAVFVVGAVIVNLRPPAPQPDAGPAVPNVILSTGAPDAPAWTAPPGDPTPRIATAFAALRILADTPGCAVAIDHAGGLVYSHGFGLTSATSNARITPDTAFLVAGLTKQFTAVSLLRLAEAGELGPSVVVQSGNRTLVIEDGSWSLSGFRAALVLDPTRGVTLALACSAEFIQPPLSVATSVLTAWEGP